MHTTFLSRYGIWILCLLFAAAGILSLNHMLIYTPDSARYLAWANSLAQFRGYIDLTVPEPARYVVHAPLYPALLVPAAWIAPTSILAAKIATLLFGTLTLAVFFLWMKTNVEWRLALGAAIALSLNSFMLIYSTQVLSEVPFFLCIVIAFWLTQDVIEKANRPPMVGWREIGLVAAVVAAIFLREVGLTLVMAMLVVLVLHKRYRTAGILFGISVLFSMAWFVRNEIVIATAEQPAMRNTHLFFSHLYTANNASLVQEFLARLSTNAAIYSEAALRLLFLPEFGLRSYMLVRPQEGMLSIALSILSIMRYPIIVCSVGGMMYGAWCARKRPATAKILLVFTSVYVVPILLYPINDNRFLFPLLSVFLALVSFAIEDLLARFKFGEGKNKIRFALATVLGLLVVFPNAAWSVSFVENGWRYHHHPVEYISDIQCDRIRPEAYLKPLHLAGKWIADNTSTTSVVLSRWKDVAFFLNNRPLLDKDPQMTPEAFSNLIRDYGITHLVAVASNNGLREYEALMCMLPHYRFETIHKVGSVEIVAVQRMGGTGNVHGDSTTVADSARWSFHKALELLAEPTAQEAESLLTQLAARTGKYGNVILHLAIAKEFGGKLDEADQILNRFQSVPQAGVFLQQAWYHKEIISRVRDAVAEQDPSLRASKFNVVAVNYRELGFRNQSYVMLNKSLQADSTFFPSLIFYAVYAYADGDVNLASKYLRKAAVENSTHILVSNLRRVLAARAELDRVHDHAARASLRLQIVDCLTAIGMREDAISELLLLLREDPQNSKALLHLAELYEVKRRFAPMRRALERYVGLNPQDQPQIVRLNELRKKWD